MKKPIISQEERSSNHIEIELSILNFKRALDNNIKPLMTYILNYLSKLF